MWSVVLIPRLQITVSAWRLLLLMRMALCWTATRELTIYSFTYLTVLSVTLAQRTGGVNLAGILGGRRGGSRRLGTPPHREGSGYGLGPSPEKKFLLKFRVLVHSGHYFCPCPRQRNVEFSAWSAFPSPQNVQSKMFSSCEYFQPLTVTCEVDLRTLTQRGQDEHRAKCVDRIRPHTHTHTHSR